MKKILIIDDDKSVTNLLKINALHHGYTTELAFDGAEGLQLAVSNDYDLILLDITLPKLDGIEVCKRIRQKKVVPIIMLTGKTDELDKVLSLELGADDYVTKPFGIRELMARIKAVLRRYENNYSFDLNKTLVFDGLTINIPKRIVYKKNYKVNLSPKEFDLLSLFAKNPGKIYSRTNLLQLVWGYNFKGYTHTVNSHINRLRSKVEFDMTNPKYILTEWGIGYKFNETLTPYLDEQVPIIV
ncbi:response regulator transcription factor [uncultured Tenacibaculum sp.]|uniref:response regulator transcription factor n=1 Tax=uncultured Tenacibaculum sp. TaxID=174713 RepID=UPI002618E0D6|nr:response regulator transcription factor [uncultured Tenacibaculum sp.]